MWKGLVPWYHQGMGPVVCSKGGCQVCIALGVLPTPSRHSLGPATPCRVLLGTSPVTPPGTPPGTPLAPTSLAPREGCRTALIRALKNKEGSARMLGAGESVCVPLG